MAFGIKVSKPGFDVNTSTIGDTLIDTTYPLLKIKTSGSGSLSVSDGSSDSDTITHSLGYVPHVWVYGQTYSINGGAKNATYTRYPFNEYSSTYYADFGFTVNTTQLIIHGDFWDETSNSDTFSYFYYIFYDE